MARSLWKPTYISWEIFSQKNNKKELILYNRAVKITPNMLGLDLHVYNGDTFFTINVDNDKIGRCVGEFAFTRKKHIGKKLRK